MSKRKKIGFLGGTFDPFHLGHLNLVVEALEKSGVEEVWICPTSLSPFKTDKPPVEISHRIEMLKLAIDGLENVHINGIEANSSGVSYTYETLCSLKEEHSDKEFILILSHDLLPHFDRWHRARDLLEEFQVFVAPRATKAYQEHSTAPWVLSKIKNKISDLRVVEVSSTEVRSRLKNGLYCAHLLPAKILDYIYKYKLYF